MALTAASLQHRGIRLTLATERIKLDAERCWRVAVIVSELITNAVHYGLLGGAGNIFIDLEVVRLEVGCRVRDDGRTIAVHRQARGSAIANTLAPELMGDVRWRFGPEGSQLLFPYDAPANLIAG